MAARLAQLCGLTVLTNHRAFQDAILGLSEMGRDKASTRLENSKLSTKEAQVVKGGGERPCKRENKAEAERTRGASAGRREFKERRARAHADERERGSTA